MGYFTISCKNDVQKYEEIMKDCKNKRFRIEKLKIKSGIIEDLEFYKDFIH